MLENAGVMKGIKRVAGASAGAIIATLIALGYDSSELREFLEQDLRRILVGKLTIKMMLCNPSSCCCEKTEILFMNSTPVWRFFEAKGFSIYLTS